MTPSQISMHHFDDFHVLGKVKEGETLNHVQDIFSRDRYFSSIEILNGTDTPIMVQDRLGMPQHVLNDPILFKRNREERKAHYNTTHWPSQVSGHAIYITYSFSFINDDAHDLYLMYQGMSAVSPVYRKISDALSYHLSSRTIHDRVNTITIQMKIDSSELIVNPVFYIQELGLIISTNATTNPIEFHPESIPEMVRIRTNNFSVDINTSVDPAYAAIKAFTSTEHRKYDSLYISIMGEVQEIPIIYDRTKGFDGIEVYAKRNVDDPSSEPYPRLKQYTFDEAFDRLGVATNIHDAANIDKIRQKQHDRQMQELELKNKELARELNADKMAHERFVLEQKQREAEQQRDFDMWMAKYKREEEERRRSYEQRILELKNQQLDKDLALKRVTEDYLKEKMERELYQSDFKNQLDIVKGTISLSGIILNFASQVLKMIPVAKPI